ncbi:MAG: 5-formyltetrahydrofolate cyclo-ligase [Nitratireductor sp.]
MSITEQKANIRKTALEKRNALDAMHRIELSLEACKIGLENIAHEDTDFDKSAIISGFFPFRSEIDMRPLLDRLAQAGHKVCLPAVIDKLTLEFRELSRGCPMADTGFGTRGPGEGAPIVEPDIMILPFSAFDLAGGRIGYGAGHYDRAIEKLVNKGKKPYLIGMGFCAQEVPNVPMEEHDMRLDAILTETDFHIV